MLRSFRFGFLAGFVACTSQSGSFAVTLGDEQDTITRTPSVMTYIIEEVDRAGNRQTVKSATWTSGGTLDLGDLPQSLVASIQLTGFDSSGTNAIVWGAVPFAALGAFDGLSIPLFVQRKGEFARMPGTTTDGRSAPLLATSARGVYIAGGGSLPLAAYDMLSLDHFGSTCSSAPAKSFALVISSKANTDGESAMAWRIDDNALKIDGLAQCTQGYDQDVHLPDGIAWSDFSGGLTVMGDDGSAYIVGPSRTSGSSGTILKIAPDPNGLTLPDAIVSTIALPARTGAATAWAPKYGVFVYGGASSSGKAGEVVSAAGAVTEIDGVEMRQGLGAVAFDDTKTMLVAGDDQDPILVDLSCPSCPPQTWGRGLPTKLSSPQLFSLGKGAFLVVGDDGAGATKAFRMTASASVEVPLKIARQGARAIQVETGQIVVIGGGSATPESYVD